MPDLEPRLRPPLRQEESPLNAKGRRQVVQRCPNCAAKYDVGIYVSGQKVRCRRCGIKFEVVRLDTQFGEKGPEQGQPQAPSPNAASPELQPRVPVSPGVAAVGPGNPVGARTPEPGLPPAPPKVKGGGAKQNRFATGELEAGTRLSGYVIDSVLGRGAMGTVYRGRQLSLERPVAIKVMSADLVGQKEFVLRFRREAAALASLSHENVVAIFDQGHVGDHWYFVMEFIDGPTLRRVMAQRALRMSRALELAVQVGRGLDYAHGKGVVHRDLKPENVLLADRGSAGYLAKICDFGLADILYSDRSFVNLTGSRISMGTVNYMAPEQRQDAGRVDQRADVFSFGVLLYEIFTGELPLGRFERPSAKNPHLDVRLDEVILRALEPDARRRFPRVREMVDAIASLAR